MKITAKYLIKIYPNGTRALDGFSVTVESGEAVSVLGPSGCGKTTLLRLLSGLDKPTAGELYFDDVLFGDIPLKERDTAVVFQDYVLYPKMTVWENVAAALGRYDLPREEEEKIVAAALSDFGLLKFRNQLPRVLSGGQQQRVALARAVVKKPSLLLLDEPLSNVAPAQRSEYMKLLCDLKKRLPETTFVYVTHNPREAAVFGDKLLIMDEGRVLQYGEKHRVWKNPYHADVLRTLYSGIKELSGEVKDGVFTSEDGTEIAFDGAPDSQGATVILNPYDDGRPFLFDRGGNALMPDTEKRFCYFDAVYNGTDLSFGGVTYVADAEFKKRFIGKTGKLQVGIESVKLRTFQLYGDIKIEAEAVGGAFRANGTKFRVSAENFSGAFYINPADIELFSDGERVLAHYKVYKSACAATAGGGKLKFPSGKLAYGGGLSGAVVVSFSRNAAAKPVKRGGLKATCLAEEDIGRCKLVYLAVKGFDNYLTFRAAKTDEFFTKKQLRIEVEQTYFELSKILRR